MTTIQLTETTLMFVNRAKTCAIGHRCTQVQSDASFFRKSHGAMQLYALFSHHHCGLAASGFSPRDRSLCFVCISIVQVTTNGVLPGFRGQPYFDEHIDASMLYCLEGANCPIKLLALPNIGKSLVEATSCRPSHLRCQRESPCVKRPFNRRASVRSTQEWGATKYWSTGEGNLCLTTQPEWTRMYLDSRPRRVNRNELNVLRLVFYHYEQNAVVKSICNEPLPS